MVRIIAAFVVENYQHPSKGVYVNKVEKHDGLWSIVLAGGEGERLRPFVERWLGRHRPKQYCAFVGTRSMLHAKSRSWPAVIGRRDGRLPEVWLPASSSLSREIVIRLRESFCRSHTCAREIHTRPS